MAKTPVFISFDYDHDQDLKTLLVGQANNPDSPFEIADWSVKEAAETGRRERQAPHPSCTTGCGAMRQLHGYSNRR